MLTIDRRTFMSAVMSSLVTSNLLGAAVRETKTKGLRGTCCAGCQTLCRRCDPTGSQGTQGTPVNAMQNQSGYQGSKPVADVPYLQFGQMVIQIPKQDSVVRTTPEPGSSNSTVLSFPHMQMPWLTYDSLREFMMPGVYAPNLKVMLNEQSLLELKHPCVRKMPFDCGTSETAVLQDVAFSGQWTLAKDYCLMFGIECPPLEFDLHQFVNEYHAACDSQQNHAASLFA